ncbi:hypothetical protein CCYA_CCYA14G3695 [Cyanidiococcus yangmingshanensis]|nr:hypothetical protein CCYA_CCYA14G3695 [Cyanidiococcus yangmingshanensis]
MAVSVCWRAVELFGVLASRLAQEGRYREAAFAWLCAAQSTEAEPLIEWPLPLAAPSPFNWLLSPDLRALVDSSEANRVLFQFWAARALFQYLVTLHQPNRRAFDDMGFPWMQENRFEVLQAALRQRQFREACILADMARLRTMLARLQVVLQDNPALQTALQRPAQRLDALQLLLHIHAMRTVISVMIEDWTSARQAISDGLRTLGAPSADEKCTTEENRSAWHSHFWLEWIRIASLEAGLDAALGQCAAAEAAGVDPELLRHARQELEIAKNVAETQPGSDLLDSACLVRLTECPAMQIWERADTKSGFTLWRILEQGTGPVQESSSKRPSWPGWTGGDRHNNERIWTPRPPACMDLVLDHNQDVGSRTQLDIFGWLADARSTDHTGSPGLDQRSVQSANANANDMDCSGHENDLRGDCKPLRPQNELHLSLMSLFSMTAAADLSARVHLHRYQLVDCARSLVLLTAAAHKLHQWARTMPAFWPWTQIIRDAGLAAADCARRRATTWYKFVQNLGLGEKFGLNEPQRFPVSSENMLFSETSNERKAAAERSSLEDDLKRAAALVRAERLIEANALLQSWLCIPTENKATAYVLASALCLQAQILGKLGIHHEKALAGLDLAETLTTKNGYRFLSDCARQLRAQFLGISQSSEAVAEDAHMNMSAVTRAKEELEWSLAHEPRFYDRLIASLNWTASVSNCGPRVKPSS